MAELSNIDKRRIERLLQMEGGYVLDFTNRTFADFVTDSIGRNIYDSRYGAGSKANQLRAFWKVEENPLVGKLLGDLLNYGLEIVAIKPNAPDLPEVRKTIEKLKQAGPVVELNALAAISDDKDFEVVSKAVRAAIDSNQLESGLDRLHTFTTKYIRSLCARRGVVVTRDKPLHSLLGEYIKRLKEKGHIESEMTTRILKTSISTLEAFNDVRNNQSLAHDNPILNYEEALLIFNHVASSIRFVRSIEGRIEQTAMAAGVPLIGALQDDDEVPF